MSVIGSGTATAPGTFHALHRNRWVILPTIELHWCHSPAFGNIICIKLNCKLHSHFSILTTWIIGFKQRIINAVVKKDQHSLAERYILQITLSAKFKPISKSASTYSKDFKIPSRVNIPGTTTK